MFLGTLKTRNIKLQEKKMQHKILGKKARHKNERKTEYGKPFVVKYQAPHKIGSKR